jgi:hypothetical protein
MKLPVRTPLESKNPGMIKIYSIKKYLRKLESE